MDWIADITMLFFFFFNEYLKPLLAESRAQNPFRTSKDLKTKLLYCNCTIFKEFSDIFSKRFLNFVDNIRILNKNERSLIDRFATNKINLSMNYIVSLHFSIIDDD